MPKPWGFLKFISIAGVGLWGDGYINITIGLVVPMIGYLYYGDDKGKIPTLSGDIIKGGFAIGMILGQLGFGLFGDALGRHKVYGKELILTLVGTLLVITAPLYLSHSGIVAWLCVFRVLSGSGAGGDYPMTSSISAENNLNVSRAKLILVIFASIGLGTFCAGIVYVILIVAFKSAIYDNIHNLQYVWRLLFGIGMIPLILTLYARLTMQESKPYEKYVAKETGLTGKDRRGLKQQFEDFRVYFRDWKHAKALFGVCSAWFLYDIAFYGINLNQSVILEAIGFASGTTTYETLWKIAIGNIIVVSAGYLPGFYIGIFLPDIFGRVRWQFVSSAIVAVLYAIWAGVTNHTTTGGLMTLFTLSQLFLTAGPNVTTFLLPVEIFPTRVRGMSHGIAAASGKCGAVLTAFAFGTVVDRIGINGTLGLLSGIMALVAAVTLLIPEPKGLTLDEIEHGVLYGEKVAGSDASMVSSDAVTQTEHFKDDFSNEQSIEEAV